MSLVPVLCLATTNVDMNRIAIKQINEATIKRMNDKQIVFGYVIG